MAEAKTTKYKTTHNGMFVVDDVIFKPGEAIGLTAEQVKKAQKAIEQGFLVKA